MEKHTLGIFIITLLGLILRVLYINKPDGLWNDEYISWMIAAKPLFDGFWSGIKSQCHMPLYYLYLKFFMSIFGQSDIVLKLTSVLSGALSIIIMYFTGLEKDKKTGLIAALFTAISSFLIYYSQEVRFYSLLFLFAALSLWFTVRLVKNTNIKNIIFLTLANLLVIFTHTIGFVYVFFNLVYISFKLFKDYKKVIIKLWSIAAVIVLAASPLIIKIFTTNSFSQWWASFSFSNWGFLLTDYFSPVLTNLVNAPANFFYNFHAGFVIFALLPALIAIFWIAYAVKKDKDNAMLLCAAAGVIIVMTIASLAGKLVFITKYSIEIYPVLLLLAAYGAASVSNKVLRNTLIILYCLIHVIYLTLSPVSAPKIRRAQGHKIAADLIKRAEPKEGDIVLIEYYQKDRFEKYIDFTGLNVITIDKGNFPEYLSQNMTYEKAVNEGKEVYRPTFQASVNGYLKEKINREIISKLKQGQSVILITLNSVAFYSPEQVSKIASDDSMYNKTPLLFLVFSHIKEQVARDFYETLAVVRYESKGDWSAVKFTKLKK